MSARRRRALAYAFGAFVVAVLCAVLSSNVEGFQRGVLLVLAGAWLVIGGWCVASALRTATPSEAPVEDRPHDVAP
jgi:hypothetical protein